MEFLNFLNRHRNEKLIDKELFYVAYNKFMI